MKEQERRFSEDCIVDSLILLMKDKEYDRITMTDVCDKAGVSRRTVYRHFDNKLDILKKYIDRLIGEYWSYVTDRIRSGENIVENSFQFIDDHFDFFRIANKNNLLINILDILHQVIAQVIRYSNPRSALCEDPDYFDSYVSYVAGGCWGLLQTWIESKTRRSPHEMYGYYRQIARDLNSRLR